LSSLTKIREREMPIIIATENLDLAKFSERPKQHCIQT